ncbi:outer membrane beta-barrel protein [Reyranella sp.]|uniref:outer membrane beta-barrel protein n=1 Tax=Reyranella sp. TaxID=1929291 RepID=UPI003BA85B7B
MTIRASRAHLIWSPVLGWVLLSCAVTVAQAQVETPSPAKQTLDEQTPTVDIPINSTSPISSLAPTRDELGITVGAFNLYPALELDVGYDSNVFATPPPTSASLYTSIRPSLELKSDWSNHMLRVLANGTFGFYPAAPTQNFQNYGILAEGRLDIQYDFYLSGLAGFRRTTEALGTPDVSFAQAPTVVDTIPVQLTLYQKFNRFFYQISAAATRYRYYDYSTITSLGLPGTSRNRTEYEERARVGYEVIDDVSFWISPGLTQRIYVSPDNSAGQERDSAGWDVQVGTTIKFTPKTGLEGFIGRQSLTYLADATSTTATTFGLTGSWNGYAPLTIRPAILRSINESALTNYQNYISTTVGVDFTYDIHGPWKAVGGISYNTADYTPAFGVADVNPRTDFFFKGSIGLLYEFRPEYSIGPVYEYTQGSTTDVAAGGPQYTRNLFTIRLVARR